MPTIYEQFPILSQDLSEDNRVWREIDQESYDIMLEILPPKRMRGNGFVMSEAYDNLENGQNIYLVCYSMREKYFATYGTVSEFDDRLLHPSKDIPKLPAKYIDWAIAANQ